jgi:transposase
LAMEKYILELTLEERASLTELAKKERISAVRRSRALIMLKADEGLVDVDIAEEVGVGIRTVERVRKRAVLEGVVAALERQKQTAPSRPSKLDGRAEAQLVRIACSEPPEGQARWTLTLLAGKLVELEVVDTVSLTTVHRRLKKTASSPGR